MEIPKPLPYDPEQAKRLLDEAGWGEKDEGGIREKNGRKFRFSLFFSADLMPGAVYIQDQRQKTLAIFSSRHAVDLPVPHGNVQYGS